MVTERPLASGPSSAARASWEFPLETPFSYSHGGGFLDRHRLARVTRQDARREDHLVVTRPTIPCTSTTFTGISPTQLRSLSYRRSTAHRQARARPAVTLSSACAASRAESSAPIACSISLRAPARTAPSMDPLQIPMDRQRHNGSFRHVACLNAAVSARGFEPMGVIRCGHVWIHHLQKVLNL